MFVAGLAAVEKLRAEKPEKAPTARYGGRRGSEILENEPCDVEVTCFLFSFRFSPFLLLSDILFGWILSNSSSER